MSASIIYRSAVGGKMKEESGGPIARRMYKKNFLGGLIRRMLLQMLSRYNLIANRRRLFDRFFLSKIQLNRE